jgi:AcrR family transcriptional regulator
VKNDRKAQERAARKKDIMEIALRLFAERDFHEVTVDDIAERVGLSKGTLYLYFENKEHLFMSILEDKTNEFYRRLSDAIGGDEPFLTRLENYCRTFLVFFEEHKPYYKIIHCEKTRAHMGPRDGFQDLVMASFSQFDDLLKRFIGEGQAKGILRNTETAMITKMLRGLLNQVAFHNVFAGESESLLDKIPSILDHFLNGACKKDTLAREDV